jgi:hypothetical protein
MFLLTKKSTQFSFIITGYESPLEIVDNNYDANWLYATIIVRIAREQWVTSIPCFLTWDLIPLRTQMESILNRETLDFKTFITLETDLSLTYYGTQADLHTFRCLLKTYCQLRSTKDNTLLTHNLWMKLNASDEDLKSNILHLTQWIQQFPPRTASRN